MKKHPVISGFLLLAIVGVSFFLILRVLVFFGEENQKFSFKNKDKIGVVTIEGVLHSSADIIKQLETYEKDGNVKAVVLRINSPGGAVVPSQVDIRQGIAFEEIQKSSCLNGNGCCVRGILYRLCRRQDCC